MWTIILFCILNITVGIGELVNFIAYTFAPASLVTPLGALSVLVSAVLASRYLNDKLNLLGKIGCFLCILGSTVIVLHSPKEEEISNLNELFMKVKQPGFVSYVFIVIVSNIVIIIFHIGPARGNQNVFMYIFLCSSVGSLTVMCCKAIGLALKETISGVNNAFSNWLTWVFVFGVILCITVQMNYLNKSLDLFDTVIVTPIYYVLFTTLVIIASAILFREWENMNVEDILGLSCGFLTVITAVFLLNGFKDMDVHYSSIRHMLRPKREILQNHNSQWNVMNDDRLIPRLESKYCYGTSNITRTI